MRRNTQCILVVTVFWFCLYKILIFTDVTSLRLFHYNLGLILVVRSVISTIYDNVVIVILIAEVWELVTSLKISVMVRETRAENLEEKI